MNIQIDSSHFVASERRTFRESCGCDPTYFWVTRSEDVQLNCVNLSSASDCLMSATVPNENQAANQESNDEKKFVWWFPDTSARNGAIHRRIDDTNVQTIDQEDEDWADLNATSQIHLSQVESDVRVRFIAGGVDDPAAAER